MTANSPALMDRKAKMRYAPAGYGFVKGRGTMLVRLDRERAEKLHVVIDRELIRLGCKTRKLKVRQFGESFFVNLWYLRGLEPLALVETLKKLPNRCGLRAVMRAIEKLPERAEADLPPPMKGMES